MIGSIRFAGDLPPAAVLIISVLAAMGVTLLYLRESKTVALPYSYLLPALRASAVVLAILILAGPIWHRRQVIGTLGRVVFAIDTSQSMSVSDSGETGSTPSRLGRATRLLTGDESGAGWLEQLRETHEVDVIAFADGEPSVLWSSRSEDPVPTVLELEATGRRTDLSVGLTSTLQSIDPNLVNDADEKSERVADERLADKRLAGQRGALVMLTDGRDNFGESATDLAKQLESQMMAVHTIGIGSQDEPADVGIVNVIRPESVASDGKLAGTLVLKQYGMSGKPLQVRIESQGQTVWQRTIDASGEGLQRIPFELDVEPIVEAMRSDTAHGVFRSTIVMDLRAAIEPIDGDSTDDNNAMPFRVAANTRDRRLLIVDGSSRWETRYLRNLFERDPAWSVNTVIFGEGTGQAKLIRGDEPGEFPDDREEMARYDAIILGEIPADQLNPGDTFRLREFVTRGGGLIVVDGRYGQLRSIITGELADLIPVKYQSDRRVPATSLEPTRMGFEHPVLNLIGETEQLAELWSEIPAPTSVANVTAQEGAEVWANVVGVGDVKTPWLVTRLFGAGRVFYLSADQTWRWRYKVADRFHARFWNQLLAAVMQPPYAASDEYVALGTNKVEYSTGESSTIRVRLHDTGGKPVGDATVDALIVADDKVVATVPLSVDDPARGTYLGQTPPLATGAYSVRVRASGFDQSALQASTPIWVSDEETAEMRRVGLDENALMQISEAGGGKYVHESSANDLLEQIRPLSSGTVVESDIVVWQTFYWFWAVIALLAIEWLLRKRAGLV